MNKSPIVVMDSGMGGLTVLKKILKLFKGEKFLYLSDCKNMPYGNKSENEVKFLCKKNLKRAKKYHPKAIIVACNTMSLMGKEIFENCDFAPVFLVEPNAEKMGELGCENCLLLCTKLSAKSAPISRLTNICSHCVVSFETLAKQIDCNPLSASEFLMPETMKKIGSKKYIFLGCTHYLFFLDYLQKIFPKKNFFDGTEEFMQKLALLCVQNGDAFLKSFHERVTFIGSGSGRARAVFSKICR